MGRDQKMFGIYNPPVSHYSHIKLSDIEREHISKIIGRAGENFKWITSISRTNYIWFKEENSAIEIWGPMDTHRVAHQMLRDLIERVIVKKPKPVQVLDMDMAAIVSC